MATRKHIRTSILTISSIAITVTGAWYGLGLKTQQEIKEVILPPKSTLPYTHPIIFPISFFVVLSFLLLLFPSLSPLTLLLFLHANTQSLNQTEKGGGYLFFSTLLYLTYPFVKINFKIKIKISKPRINIK